MVEKKHNALKRKKRGDTKIGTIEKEYGVDFGVRSDKKLDSYLKDEGLPSLSKALRSAERASRSQKEKKQ